MSAHRISKVEEDSLAWELGVEPGMELVSVDGREISDVFDYRMLMSGEDVHAVIREEDGEETELVFDLEDGEDFGIEFENGLMDDYRSCCNHCIFCFIDQMPEGMRPTLYFKDDDSRLSFLQGNYVTLTNMTDGDIDRIIRYRMEPINISVHTTNPELRVKMLRNPTAGSIFPKIKKLRDAGITMNGQIVLCKGWNDGAELERTIRDLTEYLPEMESVSVVPIGLTKFREHLVKMKPFTKEDAASVIDTIESWQKRIYPRWGTHFIHASDEWYLLAGRPLPPEEQYDGYIQYENGVGMLRLLLTECRQAVEDFSRDPDIRCLLDKKRHVISATGFLAAPYIRKIASFVSDAFPGHTADVLPIRNDYFGSRITVSGLITGGDLIRQVRAHLKSRGLSVPLTGTPENAPSELLIPVNMLRSGENLFLDDITVSDVERELGLPVRVIRESGESLVRGLLGLPETADRPQQPYETADI